MIILEKNDSRETQVKNYEVTEEVEKEWDGQLEQTDTKKGLLGVWD